MEAQQCVELSVTNGRGLAPRSLSSSSRQDPRSLQDRLMVVCSTTRGHASLVWRPIGPGGESGVVPPVPMPNTAVKRSSAHDTGVTKPRENRPVPGPFGRHTSTRAHALKDSFAVFSFAVFLFLCYSHTASAGRARAAHCVVGKFGPPERCREGHAPSAGGLPANFLNTWGAVHAGAVPVRAVRHNATCRWDRLVARLGACPLRHRSGGPNLPTTQCAGRARPAEALCE